VNLFQEDDVRIELVGSPGLQAATSQNNQRSDWGRFVTSLGSGSTAIRQPALDLAVRPNRPRVSGSMVTALSLSDDQWRLEATLQLEVVAGAIDEIRVILPEQISGPVERSPPGEVRFQPATGEGGRLLSLPFTTPIEGPLKLTIAGDLTIETIPGVANPLAAAKSRVGYQRITVDGTTGRVRKCEPRCSRVSGDWTSHESRFARSGAAGRNSQCPLGGLPASLVRR
jgi:hypothetical protein